MPDVMLLPEIAKLYCVTIDDLFKENRGAYDNFAQRLFSVYEVSKRSEDYVRAEEEFQKLFASGKATSEDWRLYGILHQYMMQDCKKKGLEAFDTVLEKEEADKSELYWRTRRQKVWFLAQIGQAKESLLMQRERVQEHPRDPQEWICLLTAYAAIGDAKAEYECFLQAKEKFPKLAMLYVYGGDACKELGKREEAFSYWDYALELDPTLCDAKYAKGFYYEEMGEWESVRAIWNEIAAECKRDGLFIEMREPQSRAEECAKRINVKRGQICDATC